MHASLNAVDISNTLYNIVFFSSDFSVIYFLTIRTCVRIRFRDVSITLYVRRLMQTPRRQLNITVDHTTTKCTVK
jgi:hypothetical protein